MRPGVEVAMMTERPAREAMRGGGLRSRLVSMGLLAVFATIAVKGGLVAMSGHSSAPDGVASAFAPSVRRADIVDRNGKLLATSVPAYSLAADPRAMMDGDLVARELASVLPDLDVETISRRLANKSRAFVWVQRGLTPRQRQAVFDLGLEGLIFREDTVRSYPEQSLAGHVLGFVGDDGQGLGGIEYSMDSRLASGGDPLVLTLDRRVQFGLEAELSAAVGEYDAERAAGIVMQARTGEVLAMASWPPINPHTVRDLDKEDPSRIDNAAASVFELGSIFKPLTVAGALDAGAVRPSDVFDVREPLIIRGQTISDDHPISARATPMEIIAHSSNIGTVKVAWQMGARRQQEFFASLGLFDRAPVELSASAKPLLPPEFDDLYAATASYGHGIAVTPIAFVGAFSALANDGERVEPTLLMEPEHRRAPKRVMSAPTAGLVTAMLRQAVLDGTGKAADVPGYQVAGKTGTAERPFQGGYSSTDNICSFAAVFPADRPEFVVLIVLDNPKAAPGRGRAAAWNAAPTAGRVIERIAQPLGLEPMIEEPVASGPRQHSVSARRNSL